MYYNTTNEEEIMVDLFELENQTQDELVLSVAGCMHKPFGPSAIYKRYPGKILITSIRSALNTLVKRGRIICIGKVMGMYGRKEKLYKIRHETTKDYRSN